MAEKKPKAYAYCRFSSAEQKKGNSYERQIELAQKWADRNGYELHDHIQGIKLLDEGESAYHSEHFEKGAFGKFHKLAVAGNVEGNAVLLIESLDRISREAPVVFLTRFFELIETGVAVIEVSTGKEYSRKGGFGITDIIMAGVTVSRSNNESEAKSKRSSDNQNRKRRREQEVPGFIGDGRRPAWIQIDLITKKGTLIPERADLIRWMVDEYLVAGHGFDYIAKSLNRRKIPPWVNGRKAERWTKTRVQKILHNRALIGEHTQYEFPKNESGRVTSTKIKDRVPVATIKNNFEAVIDGATFDRIQRQTKKNGGNKKGRKPSVKNLFPAIAKCAYCGVTMEFDGKGVNSRGWGDYLVCSSRKNGGECTSRSLPLPPMEEAFLRWCREVDLGSLVGQTKIETQATHIENQLAVLEGQLETAIKERDSLRRQGKFLADDDEAMENGRQLSIVAGTIKRAEREIADKQHERAELLAAGTTILKHLEALKDLNTQAQNADSVARDDIRLRMRNLIADTVTRIDCFPDGLRNNVVVMTDDGIRVIPYAPWKELIALEQARNPPKYSAEQEELFFDIAADAARKGHRIAPVLTVDEAQAAYDAKVMAHVKRHSGADNRVFLVHLKNGNQRAFSWDPDAGRFNEWMVFDKKAKTIMVDGVVKYAVFEDELPELTEAEIENEIAYATQLQ